MNEAKAVAKTPQQTPIEKSCVFDVRGDAVELTVPTVKNYLTRGDDSVSDQEVVMFINLCKYQRLNPFLNEAYLIKFKGSPAQIITSKEAYMRKADACANYDGMRAGVIVRSGKEVADVEGSFCGDGQEVVGGWCEVYRKDRTHPTRVRVALSEYDKKRSTWNSMRNTMIRKVAIVHALREAFPSDLNGMYMEEEAVAIQGADAQNEIAQFANTEPFDAPPPAINGGAREVKAHPAPPPKPAETVKAEVAKANKPATDGDSSTLEITF